MIIEHPESENGLAGPPLYRRNPELDQNEFWNEYLGRWSHSMHNYINHQQCIGYNETWCEPYEGMDDE